MSSSYGGEKRERRSKRRIGRGEEVRNTMGRRENVCPFTYVLTANSKWKSLFSHSIPPPLDLLSLRGDEKGSEEHEAAFKKNAPPPPPATFRSPSLPPTKKYGEFDVFGERTDFRDT